LGENERKVLGFTAFGLTSDVIGILYRDVTGEYSSEEVVEAFAALEHPHQTRVVHRKEISKILLAYCPGRLIQKN